MAIAFVTNRLSATIRYDEMEGRQYLVVPMVMITPGVHNGNNGPLLYTEGELAKAPGSWNYKPIVVYHPILNGRGISACSPDVITKQKVGVIMNARWDDKAKKLRAEAWLEKDRLETVDSRVMEALEAQRKVEVSTGLDSDLVQNEGTHEGKQYIAVVTNIRPDHLAILPDIKGACSIADGAGLLQLNASYNDVMQGLMRELRSRWGDNVWLLDAWEGLLVYEREGELYSLSYTIDDANVAKLGDELPNPVRREVVYRQESTGSIIGNSTSAVVLSRKDQDMSKKELVDGLIANQQTEWTEADRTVLDGFSEDQLKKMTPKLITNSTGNPTTPPANPTPTPNPAPTPTPNPAPTTTQPAPQPSTPKSESVAEYITNAPAPLQGPLKAMMASYEQQKATLVQTITANQQNVFSAEYLNTLDVPQLQGIAALAAQPQPAQPQPPMYATPGQNPIFNYAGQAPVPVAPAQVQNGQPKGDDGLQLPTINWDELSPAVARLKGRHAAAN